MRAPHAVFMLKLLTKSIHKGLCSFELDKEQRPLLKQELWKPFDQATLQSFYKPNSFGYQPCVLGYHLKEEGL